MRTGFALNSAVTAAVLCLQYRPVRCFLLVINANSGFSADKDTMKREIRRHFLKEKLKWPNAVNSDPFGRSVDSTAHKAFITAVLRMTEAELNAHWSKFKQTTGDTPPREVDRPRMLLRQIARRQGAFSAIGRPEARKLPARVRVLFEFSDG